MLRAAGVTLVLVAGLGGWYAASDAVCTRIPPRHWMSPFEIELRLREADIRVQSVRVTENRCYDVIGRDKYGSQFVYLINPADGQIASSDRLLTDAGTGDTSTRPATPQAMD